MSIREQVLQTLKNSSGKFISGEEMGNDLGVSRAAVWKAVTQLKREGVKIEGIRHRGYRIRKDWVKLDMDALRSYLPAQWRDIRLEGHEIIDSTNREAKTLASVGAAHGTVVIADTQTAGRGRLGRSFASPPQGGVYMSIILQKHFPAEAALDVTTMAAVAVCKVIEELTGKTPGIKWVNDLYLNKRKVCGILTEASANMESLAVDHVVVGIGINLSTRLSDFPKELSGIAGSVFEDEEPTVSREELAAAVISRILDNADMLGTHAHMPDYRSRCMNLGKTVSFDYQGAEMQGKAEEITDCGALAVRMEDGSRLLLNAGEVSIQNIN